jgi:uncharacterized protein (DUF2147 family)
MFARLGTIALVGLAALCGTRPSPAATPFPTGTWLTEDGRARVRTERCRPGAAQLCGYVVWLQKPLDDDGHPRADRFNADLGKRDRTILGHQMFLGLYATPQGHYEGKVYSGDNGKSYDVAVWSDAPSTLTVEGCMLVFCGKQTWTRVTDVVPGQLQGPTDAAGGPRSDPEWTAKPTATGSIQPRKAQPVER